MGNAIWLVLALPKWYGWPILVLAAGTLAAALGLEIAGTISPKFRRFWPGNLSLLLFVLPFVASETLVGIAGALRGKVHEPYATCVLCGFLIVQLVFSPWLIYRLKGARIAASALAVFSMTYALEAAFIAGMAFTDSWL